MRWQFFTLDEFRCPCCGLVDMSDEFITKLDNFRRDAGFAFHVSSGYRCHNHNQAIGGAPNSAHRLGRAADLSVDGKQTSQLMNMGFEKYGFYGVGISQKRQLRMLHLDDLSPKEVKVRPNVWTY